MPELPEVETVRLTLKNLIIGKQIKDIVIHYGGIVRNVSLKTFKQKLINQTFRDIRRKGKYLFFDFDSVTLTSHLRMEGKYFIRENFNDITKHEHIIFILDDGKYLSYHDVRKFGTMDLTSLLKETELKSIQLLGKEINGLDLTVDYLYPLINASNRPIKSLLLDQHIVCGLGNIYVDETLFLSRINPVTPGKQLSVYQVEKIIKSSKAVIKKAINLGGTTIRTYQSSFGVDGRFQNELNVHTLEGETCENCNDVILKTRVGGRGTYYCPTCQRNDKTLVIGLTGGISSGKTLVAQWLKKRKITVLDADKIYKKLLKTNKIMYNEIANQFGKAVTKGNSIDKLALGKIIFNNKSLRLKLNQITHPFIMHEMLKQINDLIKNDVRLIVLDIPLLFETKLEYLTNLIILVYTNKENQIKRLIQRDQISEAEALKKINSQMDLSSKIDLADIVVDNSYDIKNTEKQLEQIYEIFRRDRYVI